MNLLTSIVDTEKCFEWDFQTVVYLAHIGYVVMLLLASLHMLGLWVTHSNIKVTAWQREWRSVNGQCLFVHVCISVYCHNCFTRCGYNSAAESHNG